MWPGRCGSPATKAIRGHHAQHVLIDQLFDERQLARAAAHAGLRPAPACLPKARPKSAPTSRSPRRTSAQRCYRELLFRRRRLDDRRSRRRSCDVEDLQPSNCCRSSPTWRGSISTARITQERAIERSRMKRCVANPEGTLAFIERRRARALVYGEGRRVDLCAAASRGPRRAARAVQRRDCVTVMRDEIAVDAFRARRRRHRPDRRRRRDGAVFCRRRAADARVAGGRAESRMVGDAGQPPRAGAGEVLRDGDRARRCVLRRRLARARADRRRSCCSSNTARNPRRRSSSGRGRRAT